MKNTMFIILVCSLFVKSSQAQDKTNPLNQSEELGKVSWHRDYDQALALAKKESKAVRILFLEVPGCMTCRNYGQHVLSHPLMVCIVSGAGKVIWEKQKVC